MAFGRSWRPSLTECPILSPASTRDAYKNGLVRAVFAECDDGSVKVSNALDEITKNGKERNVLKL